MKYKFSVGQMVGALDLKLSEIVYDMEYEKSQTRIAPRKCQDIIKFLKVLSSNGYRLKYKIISRHKASVSEYNLYKLEIVDIYPKITNQELFDILALEGVYFRRINDFGIYEFFLEQKNNYIVNII